MFKIKIFLSIVAGILFIISFSVILTLNFKPLYYFDMDFLGISERSGLSENEIYINYNDLIDYNNITGPNELNFHTFDMSDNGRIHFREVKQIFIFTEKILFLTAIFFLISCVYYLKNKVAIFFKITGIASLVIPCIIGGFIAFNWQDTFVYFHKIVFDNDYWLFDSRTDPVILILPDQFFMHCAIMVIFVIVILSIICYLIGLFLSKKGESFEDHSTYSY